MPLEQPRRDNRLMKSYLRQTGLSSMALARRCGVSHSQMYMARERNVGAENAEHIASCVGGLLGLSVEQKLELKAEIMGHPGNLVRAYLGDGSEAARKLGLTETLGREIVHPAKTVAYRPGRQALRRLREMGAPSFIVEAVEAKVRPEYRPPGRVTHRMSGIEARNRRVQALFNLHLFKPKTAAALEQAGLSKKEIRERSGLGRETVRKALYERCGAKAATKIG